MLCSEETQEPKKTVNEPGASKRPRLLPKGTTQSHEGISIPLELSVPVKPIPAEKRLGPSHLLIHLQLSSHSFDSYSFVLLTKTALLGGTGWKMRYWRR